MTQEEKIKQLDHNLSVQVLLESILYSHVCENFESMKQTNPILANMVRNVVLLNAKTILREQIQRQPIQPVNADLGLHILNRAFEICEQNKIIQGTLFF